MSLAIALTTAAMSFTGSCPVEHALYALRDAPGIVARFEARKPTPGWPADVQFSLHSSRTGTTYFFLPYSGNGQGVTTHFASVENPSDPPDPDSAAGRPLGDLDYLAANRSYAFEKGFYATTGHPAPAHLFLPALQEALWYRPDKREGVPIAFFDLVGCAR